MYRQAYLILRHQSIKGTCLFCGMKTGHLQLPDVGAEEQFSVGADGTIQHDDSIYRECPRARWILGLLYFGLFLPFLFLSGGWAPALFALLAGVIGTGLLFPPSEARWVGLSEVKAVYDGLRSDLKSGRRDFYLRSLDESLEPLFKLRDRALQMARALADQPAEAIENQLDVIRVRSAEEQDADLVEIYRAQIRDLYQLIQKREQMQRFLTKFEASKKSVVASISLLKSKILVAEQTGDSGEERRIMEDLKTLHSIYERVSETGSPANDTPSQVFRRDEPPRAGNRTRETNSGVAPRIRPGPVVPGESPELAGSEQDSTERAPEISDELRERLEKLPSRHDRERE